MAANGNDWLSADKSLGYLRSEDLIGTLGSIASSESDSELFHALGRLVENTNMVADEDLESAFGYAEVLGAVQRPMILSRVSTSNPRLLGNLAVASQRMNAIIRAGTTRQSLEMLRPDAFMIFEFTHGGAGALTISAKPTLPGVAANYTGAPLSLRQQVVLLLAGAYASAKLDIKIQQLPIFQYLAPTGVTAPVGIGIERFAPSSYQAGLKPPSLRETEAVTLLTEFTVLSTATAAVTYQYILEFRARFAFGAARCLSSRGPSIIHGPTGILARAVSN